MSYPSHQQFTYDYGRMLGLVGEYQKALPYLANVQHFSEDAAYNYAVVLEKTTPEGGCLTEVFDICQRLASKGHLDAACSLVALALDNKAPNDYQSLITYKGYVNNSIKAALLRKKRQGPDDNISKAYNALRNLYTRNKSLFYNESVRAIDFSEKAYLFNPLNPELKLVYAADLKDIGEYQQALEHFLSLQQSGHPVILNSIGSCYDFLAKQAETPSKSDELVGQALAYYNQEVQGIHSPHRAKAAFNIYSLSIQNRITPLEDGEIVNLLQIAADGGDEDALNDLGAGYMGAMYGLSQDLMQAENLLRKAIAQGCPTAKINLMNILNTIQGSSEIKEEARQLYAELWREHPEEFKKYLVKIIQSIQKVFLESEHEGSEEEKEEDESGQHKPKYEPSVSASLTASSSTEEEYTEEDWKKYEGKEKTTTTSLQQEPQQSSVMSKTEIQQQEEQQRLQRKYERMMGRVENLRTKKQAKYRKIQTLIGQHINAFGGGVKKGKTSGSGLRVEIGGAHSGLHQPHGSNGTQIDRGALKSMTTTMQRKTELSAKVGDGMK